jgi:hypothetical protein
MPHSTAEQVAEAFGGNRRRVLEYVRLGMPRLGAAISAVLALAAIAPGQTKPSIADGPWSGNAQCDISVQGPGYTHHETHTWTLTASQPMRQGAMRIYAGTWSVSGQGSLERAQGTQKLTAQWTTKASLPAPLAIFVRASDGKLLLKSWHAQLRSKGGVTGTQKQEINGVVQTPEGVISLEAFEWQFPLIELSASSPNVSGSSNKPTNGSVGPMQPAGSQGTAACTWQFTGPAIAARAVPK